VNPPAAPRGGFHSRNPISLYTRFGNPYWNLIHLTGVPANCRVNGPNPTEKFTVMFGETIDIEFTVVCSP
jgi:hypothetical protein